MSLHRICDGCGRRIAEDDRAALRDLPVLDAPPIDYCGGCVVIIRTELPGLAAAAREARRAAAAEPVHSRALALWRGGPVLKLPDTRT